MRPLARGLGLIVLALCACNPPPLDRSGARVVLERDPSGLHAADFRPYRVEIGAEGAFTFTCHGLDSVTRVESGHVPPKELESLLRGALELDFFELEERYSMGFSDGILEVLEVTLGGRSQVVRNYWPGGTEENLRELGFKVPTERYPIHRGLSDLAQRIDKAVGTEDRLARLIAQEGPRK